MTAAPPTTAANQVTTEQEAQPSQGEINILDLLLGSQEETLLEPEPPAGQQLQTGSLGRRSQEAQPRSSQREGEAAPLRKAPQDRKRKNLFRCTNCNLGFYTDTKLQEHLAEEKELQAVIDDIPQVVDPVPTTTGKKDKAAHKRNNKSARGKRKPQRLNLLDQGGKTCSTCGVSFLCDSDLERHRSEHHQTHKNTGRTRKVGTRGLDKKSDIPCQWCAHCANYVQISNGMAQHIKEAHNFQVKKAGRSPTHTKIVRVNPGDITDAAVPHGSATVHVTSDEKTSPHKEVCLFCEKTFASEWGLIKHMEWLHLTDTPHPGHVTKDLRDHVSGASGARLDPMLPAPGYLPAKRARADKQGSPSTAGPSSVVDTKNTSCPRCTFVAKTRKGLTYHLLQVHGVQVHKRDSGKASQQTEERRHTPPRPQEVTQDQVTRQQHSTAACAPGISLLGDTIRYAFPIPRVVACPVRSCRHTFATKAWFTTNTSVKRHMTTVHRMPNKQVEFWCTVCSRRIAKKPANHKCLVDIGLTHHRGDHGEWPCPECDFVATTKNGLQNHAKSHRRREVEDKMVPLRLPVRPRTRKAIRRRKLEPLSTGEPGEMPLAPPPDSPQAVTHTTAEEDADTARGERIDVRHPQLLTPFVEALDTLLEIDEIQGRKDHFESLVANITRDVREHFHLAQPPVRKEIGNAGTGGLDVHDPQKVQKMYRWNRRKCIRALTHANSTRCPVSQEATQTYFKGVWETSNCPAERPMPEPPVRPPIVDSLSPAFVAACLQSAENSAPGPDLISYRHWREIDPS
ncbi:retrovirus-related Pol polyprotein from type-1 retrotransposable element R2, partial [Trichonephila clavata]